MRPAPLATPSSKALMPMRPVALNNPRSTFVKRSRPPPLRARCPQSAASPRGRTARPDPRRLRHELRDREGRGRGQPADQGGLPGAPKRRLSTGDH